mmetsp:Transcript_22318/g.48501  ORF Transcript_22318/g.48501 Transcript_22318/m.48501 type:complete len:344 (+) Transcript_22318:257-1288(+)
MRVNYGAPESPWLVDEEGQRWFIYRQGMTWEDIPDGVTHVIVQEGTIRIEDDTFHNGDGKFDSLQVIKIAKTLEEIGARAFDRCKNLVKVEIPTDSCLTTIGQIAFRYCAFRYCVSLEDITLPQSIRTLGEGTFYQCRCLAKINFPPQLNRLGNGCFDDSGLTKADLGHCLLMVEIPAFGFSECGQLETIALPPNLEMIGKRAFHRCASLKSILFPKTIRQIESSSFEDCLTLTTLEFESFATISALMTDPRDSRFFGCRQLHTIKWSPNQEAAIPPAIWPQIIAKGFWSDRGLLQELPARNRHSCIFSFLCSIREELRGNQRPLHPMKETSEPKIMRKTGHN